jgi:choline dehydrogenase-like flavoprotein
MLQVIRSQKVYDVCVIGSGAAGGIAAKVLTEGGLEVVMLEAGPLLNPAKHFTEHLWLISFPIAVRELAVAGTTLPAATN